MKILVTGGAGFIGSNLVDSLMLDERVSHVTVLDNLSTGFLKNLKKHEYNTKLKFIDGDIRDYKLCLEVTKGIDFISHQAALGSVPRSIKDPITTNEVNIGGTLNIFNSAVKNKIKKVVFAASSSTYGNSLELPKVENVIGKPLSPYAITKYVNELYAEVFSNTYSTFNFIGLRYFNVFGPNQDPNGAYAAVIPLFFKAAIEQTAPIINGDGKNSRDFTFVENAVEANLKSLFTTNHKSNNEIYNIACGERTNLNELWGYIKEITKTNIMPSYGPNREGDIPHSLASIDKARILLKYTAKVKVREGLKLAYKYYNNT